MPAFCVSSPFWSILEINCCSTSCRNLSKNRVRPPKYSNSNEKALFFVFHSLMLGKNNMFPLSLCISFKKKEYSSHLPIKIVHYFWRASNQKIIFGFFTDQRHNTTLKSKKINLSSGGLRRIVPWFCNNLLLGRLVGYLKLELDTGELKKGRGRRKEGNR